MTGITVRDQLMPLHVEPPRSATPPAHGGYDHGAVPHAIVIGLLNNMPDAALEATEGQFTALLDAAAGSHPVRLRFSYLPGVPRGPAARERVERTYWSLEELLRQAPDALIVTGTEPRAASLTDEPYWAQFVEVLNWAEAHTVSSIWSCLAAHAAVEVLDGVRRQRLQHKRFGVFEHSVLAGHPLMRGVSAPLRMPHSRWNDIPEDALASCGYRVLTRSEDAGVDAFVRQRNSLFVFFQGHPEYEAPTLLLEYRRDIKRFLRRERETYPPMPRGYFDDGTVAALSAIRERALSDRREELLAEFPTDLAAGRVTNTWGPAAARVYRNWLLYMCAQKSRRLQARQGRQECDVARP